MKITKRQLRALIREAIKRDLINEGSTSANLKKLWDYIQEQKANQQSAIYRKYGRQLARLDQIYWGLVIDEIGDQLIAKVGSGDIDGAVDLLM